MVFDRDASEVRGIGDMLRGEGAPQEGPTGSLARKAGQKKGWRSLSGGSYVAYKNVSRRSR